MRTKLRSKISLLFMTCALLIAIPAVAALADNVQNDVVAGGNDTITAGGSTTVNYKIAANNGDGQTGCNAADASPATVTINAPAGVTATPGSLSFTSCGTDKPVVFSSSTAGDYDITVSVSDGGTGTYNTSPAKFTLHVNPTPPPSDTTPPVITPTVVGTLGDNGWYVSDVTVSWLVEDGESDISSQSGCDPTTINSDTAGQTLTCTATSAGGQSSDSVTIKRDATDPTISGSKSPAATSFGWNNGPVTVSYTCGDNLSGAASCGPDQTLSNEGAGQSSTGTATDNAGNTASTTVSNINIDLTDPDVSLVGGPTNGGSYYFGSVPSAPTCDASDGLSGLDGTCSVSGYGTTVGTHTVTAEANDKAGNTNSASSTYTVLGWDFRGFYQPVDMNNTLNTVKGGSTVPIKFELFAGSTELTATSNVVTPLKAQKVNCTGLASTEEDPIELTATGGTSLRYDSTGGQYIYNWQTPKQAGACYSVTVSALDGSSQTAYFKLK
jgi:hypothetical protein